MNREDVRRLPLQLDDVSVGAARLGTAVHDLLTVALAARVDRLSAVPTDTRRRALRARIHAYIEDRLPDPDLTPATVAAAHHISLRYLHRLFEAEEQTVAGLIRQRCLEHCQADLLDPALADRVVAAIALRWVSECRPLHPGFQDAFGVPPGGYRLSGVAASP